MPEQRPIWEQPPQPPPSPPPGWYPDPNGTGGTRWWTGYAWAHQPGAVPGGARSTPASRQGLPEAAKGLLIAGGLVALILIVVAILGAMDSGRSSPGTGASPGEKLALLAGDGTSEDAVRPYRLGLNAAEPVCNESRDRIADIVYAGEQTAEDHGVDVTALELLRAIPGAVPSDARPTNCADVVGTLIVLMRP